MKIQTVMVLSPDTNPWGNHRLMLGVCIESGKVWESGYSESRSMIWQSEEAFFEDPESMVMLAEAMNKVQSKLKEMANGNLYQEVCA